MIGAKFNARHLFAVYAHVGDVLLVLADRVHAAASRDDDDNTDSNHEQNDCGYVAYVHYFPAPIRNDPFSGT